MTKIALITGASRGLGAALAEELAGAGYHVVAVARTSGALEELDDRIRARGGEATLAPMDVTNVDAMAHLARAIHDRWGHVDLWAHTAVHAPPLAPAAHMDTADWHKAATLNALAPGNLIPMIAPLLVAAGGGHALFFDDPQAGRKFYGAYGATKAAGIALANSWQQEALAERIAVHVLTPAPMATATRARFHPGEDRGRLASPAAEARRLLAQVLA